MRTVRSFISIIVLVVIAITSLFVYFLSRIFSKGGFGHVKS